ncbi:TPA: AAA family ATPase [Enterococcus faecalis]
MNKLIVQGIEYQRTLRFTEGLNIISGEKTSGKSLILSLIDYCLGKSSSISLRVQNELADHVDTIFLEITIRNDVFTVSRDIKKNKSIFWVYYCSFENIFEYIPKKLDKSSYLNFLMGQLGITEFKKIKNKSSSKMQTVETISFRDIFRYCFVTQHELGTQMFLSNNEYMKKYKNKYAFEMIFDLIDYSQNEIQKQMAEINNTIIGMEEVKSGLEMYLKERDAEDFSVLQVKISELEKLINDKVNFKNELVEQSKNIKEDNSDFILLKSDLLKIDSEIERIKNDIRNTEMAISSNKLLINDYKNELQDIKVTVDINHKFTVDSHILVCPLCDSKIENIFTDNKSENIIANHSRLISDINKKIKMVQGVIDSDLKMIKVLEEKRNTHTRRRVIYEAALNEYMKDISIPKLPELNSLNIQIGKLEKEKNIYLECYRVHRGIDNQNKDIDKENEKLAKLKLDLSKIENKELNKKEMLKHLNKSYTENMRQFKYTDLYDTYIHGEEYTPYYRGASVYEQESGGLLECMQISFLVSIIENLFAKKHPRVLMLDSISKYFGTNKSEELDAEEIPKNNVITDPEVYENIFEILVKLSKNTQVIVVENTPPDKFSQFVQYTFYSGEHGLVDLNKNEYLLE